MNAVTAEERIAVLEDLLLKMDECAELIRQLGDDRINAYCLAAFEGRERGWLGEFERDILEQELVAARLDRDEEAGAK